MNSAHPFPVEVTFNVFAVTRSPVVVAVLTRAMSNPDPTIRKRAVETLVARHDASSHHAVIDAWPQRREEILGVLGDVDSFRNTRPWNETVGRLVESADEDSERARRCLDLVRSTQSVNALSPLMTLFQNARSPALVEMAGQAINAMCVEWGQALHRSDRSSALPMHREPLRRGVAQRLRDESGKSSFEDADLWLDHSIGLSRWDDEFWTDATLWTDGSTIGERISDRFFKSDHAGLLRMLASGLRKTGLPDAARRAIAERTDEPFRDCLLETITPDPSVEVLEQLKLGGMPAALLDGPWVAKSPPAHVAAWVQAVSAADGQSLATVDRLLSLAERHDQPMGDKIAASLSRCTPPTLDVWVDATATTTSSRPTLAQSVMGRLLERGDSIGSPLCRAAKRLLGSLDARHVIPLLRQLDDAHQARLGQAVLRHDATTVDVIRDGLRHPLLRFRLEAMDLVERLAIIERMNAPLKQIATTDHQTARVRAAEIFGNAHDDVTLGVLCELAGSPQTTIAQTAAKSLRRRQRAGSQT